MAEAGATSAHAHKDVARRERPVEEQGRRSIDDFELDAASALRPPSRWSARNILALQRAVGNRAVGRMGNDKRGRVRGWLGLPKHRVADLTDIPARGPVSPSPIGLTGATKTRYDMQPPRNQTR